MRYALSLLLWFVTVLTGIVAVPICLWTGLPLGPWGNDDLPRQTFWGKYTWLAWRNPAHNIGHWLGVVQSQCDIQWQGEFPNDYFGRTGKSFCVATLGSNIYWQRYALIPLFGKWCLEHRMGWKFRPDAPGGYIAALVFRPIALRKLK